MYFSRVTFNSGSMDPEELVDMVKGNPYAIHSILWKLFPDMPNAKRDFLFRREAGNGWPFFYMVSKRQPQTPNGKVKVETKSYHPKLSVGQQLSFCLRANPIVTKKDINGKRLRHDVVMNEKHNLSRPFSVEDSISSGELEFLAGIKWLSTRSKRMGIEFNPEEVRVYGYQQHWFKSQKQKPLIKISSLDYSGLLTVTNPESCCYTLSNGIGPAKAFGCGLMLVRRV